LPSLSPPTTDLGERKGKRKKTDGIVRGGPFFPLLLPLKSPWEKRRRKKSDTFTSDPEFAGKREKEASKLKKGGKPIGLLA